MDNKATCSNCLYWKVIDPDRNSAGECRTNAPSPVAIDGDVMTVFPDTPPDLWCGQYAPSAKTEPVTGGTNDIDVHGKPNHPSKPTLVRYDFFCR